MKKIYSLAFAAVAIISAVSCQKELSNDNLIEGGDFTVTATVAATKTVLDDAAKAIYWTPGDKITLFDSEKNTVSFSTDITSNATTAKFTNDAEFNAPASLLAIYPAKADAVYDGTSITQLRIAGTQTAVAGSFDPAFAVAVGTETEEGVLKFNNVHSLVKFTVGGEKAPKQVVLTNGGARNIAGLFWFNIEDGKTGQNPDSGAKTITLNPAEGQSFQVGEAYYIAVIGGGNFANVTLEFDGEVVKKVEGPKYADETNGFLINKIIDFGTVAFPVEEEPVEPVESPFNVERVWGYYSTESSAWWTGKADGFRGSWFGGDTSLAMDDEYVYIPYGTGTAGVYKMSIATGEISDLPVGGVTGGTYPTSCARMVRNSDPNVNGGKDVLLVGNLALVNEPLKFYAYVNGIDADPVLVYQLDAARRFGDKFSVTGTWQSGTIWLRSNQVSPLEAVLPINNGALQTWIDAYRITNSDDNCISELSWYPVDDNTKQDYCLMSTTSDQGVHLMKGCSTKGTATEEAVFPELAKTWGYQFFEFNGEKFIAWVSLKYGNDKPRLQIIKGDGSSLETLKSALSQLKANMVAEIALSNEANDLTVAGKAASKTLADCAVRVINGTVYVAALGEEGGLSLFKLTAK